MSALLVLGNTGIATFAPVIERMAGHWHTDLREAAVRATRRMPVDMLFRVVRDHLPPPRKLFDQGLAFSTLDINLVQAALDAVASHPHPPVESLVAIQVQLPARSHYKLLYFGCSTHQSSAKLWDTRWILSAAPPVRICRAASEQLWLDMPCRLFAVLHRIIAIVLGQSSG